MCSLIMYIILKDTRSSQRESTWKYFDRNNSWESQSQQESWWGLSCLEHPTAFRTGWEGHRSTDWAEKDLRWVTIEGSVGGTGFRPLWNSGEVQVQQEGTWKSLVRKAHLALGVFRESLVLLLEHRVILLPGLGRQSAAQKHQCSFLLSCPSSFIHIFHSFPSIHKTSWLSLERAEV